MAESPTALVAFVRHNNVRKYFMKKKKTIKQKSLSKQTNTTIRTASWLSNATCEGSVTFATFTQQPLLIYKQEYLIGF